MSPKKKVLFILPNLAPGGSQKIVINLINSINNKDYFLFTYKKNLFLINHIKNKRNIILSNSKKILLSFFEINNLIKKNNFSVIFSAIRNMNIIIGLFSYFFSQKIELVFHETNTFEEFKKSSISKKIKIYLMRFAYKKARYIIANSNDTMKDLLNYEIVPKNKVRIISNPIDIPKIKDRKLRIIKKLIKNKYVVVGCGTLSYQKNFELLIKSFYLFQKKIPHSYLIILGEGEMKDKLIDIIQKNKIKDKVKILKPINNPYDLFKISDMFVLSSLYEGFGNVLVEALFAKMNIVSTKCPGGPRLILKNGKYGYLAKNNHVQDLYYKMINCYEKPKTYNIKNIKKKYSSKIISQEYLKFF